MKVILLQDVKTLGKKGDVVEVSDGYARNQLIPKGFAKEATQGNVRNLEKQKALAAEKKAAQKEAAQKQADELEKVTIEIKTKGGDNGKLFGSITSKDIAEALEEQYGLKVDKKKIDLAAPIKQTGVTNVTIKLFPEVSAKVKVKVTV